MSSKVVLSGYMGCGKSSVGRLLGVELGLGFVDLDDYLEIELGAPISEIFARGEEIAFRKSEHEMLAGLLQCNDTFVLALGGGTPCYANNHLLLRDSGAKVFFLQTSVENLTSRLLSDVQQRPLIDGIGSDYLQEFIAKHLFDRNYFYGFADHTISTDGKSPEEICREIAGRLT